MSKRSTVDIMENSKDFFTSAAIVTKSIFSKYEDLNTLLESKNDLDVLDALNHIIMKTGQGRDMSCYFPSIIKSIASTNEHIRKIVSVLISRYSSTHSDVVLLCISTLQKGLKNPNHTFRGHSLKTLLQIESPLVLSIQLQAIIQSSTDNSWYVRKIGCLGISSLLKHKDDINENHLIKIVEKLLSDSSFNVVGSAIQILYLHFPDRPELIHKAYRRICQNLSFFDDFGLHFAIELLIIYVRSFFTDPRINEAKETPRTESTDEFNTENSKPVALHPDLDLLFSAIPLLVNNMNSSVLMSTVRLIHYCCPDHYVDYIKSPIERLCSENSVGYLALTQLDHFIGSRKSLFQSCYKSFYIKSTDNTTVIKKKMDILCKLLDDENWIFIIDEFEFYASYPWTEVSTYAIHTLGICAVGLPTCYTRIFQILTKLLRTTRSDVVDESVVVMRALIQLNVSSPQSDENFKVSLIEKLGLIYPTIREPKSRESIIWLICEYSDQVKHLAPDVLRMALKNFSNEPAIVKNQIMNLALRLSVQKNSPVVDELCGFAFNVFKYDPDIDIRDRSRFLSGLMELSNNPEKILFNSIQKTILLPKPAPDINLLDELAKPLHEVGTLSYTVNETLGGYSNIPPFADISCDSALRDSEVKEPIEERSKHPLESGSTEVETEDESDTDNNQISAPNEDSGEEFSDTDSEEE